MKDKTKEELTIEKAKKKLQEEEKKKVAEFQAKYNALCLQYGIQLSPMITLQVTKRR